MLQYITKQWSLPKLMPLPTTSVDYVSNSLFVIEEQQRLTLDKISKAIIDWFQYKKLENPHMNLCKRHT